MSRSARTRFKPSTLLPPARAAARSVPLSRTSARTSRAITAAATPKTTDTPRQPINAMSGVPMIAMRTVPMFPPAIWALIANPRRSGVYCSARSPLPTGCCGDPPIRAATFGIANVMKLVASDIAANPPPNRRPPAVSSRFRDTCLVSSA